MSILSATEVQELTGYKQPAAQVNQSIGGAMQDQPIATVSRIPFEELAITAAEAGKMLGYSVRGLLQCVATRPDFPVRLTRKPATWRAGDVMKWRDEQQQNKRRKRA